MKSKTILILAIAALVVAAAVFALLNAGDVGAKRESQDSATVTVVRGETKKTFDLTHLKSLPKANFDATVDTSKAGPEERKFGGVPLTAVLSDQGFSLDGARQVVFKAADGYTSVVTAEEAALEGNVYLVYERDGKPSGTKQGGGSGPIEIVIAKDQFAQRWCKFLMEITIE